MIDIRALLLDPVDLRGLPHINGDNFAHWCPPAFLPHDPDSRGVLFLDELNAACQMVQASCYSLVLDRKIAEYELPEGWTVIAAGNRETDRAVAHRMPSALANRFIHIEFEVDNDDWYKWAAQHDIRPEVISFIKYRPELLHQFDPKKDDKSFPTPRSWEFVSKMVSMGMEGDIEHAIIAGAVGSGAAAELIGFLRIFRDLPNIRDIIAKPDKYPVPQAVEVKYALCGAMAAVVDKENIKPLSVFFERLPAEFGVLAMRESYYRCPGIRDTDAFTQWAASNMEVLV